MAAEAAPAPATPFPSGDPRNAKYFETVAALEHQLNNNLASDTQNLANLETAYKYSAGTLDRQLPITLQGTRNTANSQGLLESGQLAQRVGSVETKYAAQRGRLTSALQQDQNRINQAENAARESFNLGRTRAANEARENALKETEQQQPNEAPTTATPTVANPGGTAQPITGSTASAPFKWSRNPAVRARQARQLAARRSVG